MQDIEITQLFLFQEIGLLRQSILSCEGELRTVSSPAYLAKDRDKAIAEQSVGVHNLLLDVVSCKVQCLFCTYGAKNFSKTRLLDDIIDSHCLLSGLTCQG